MALHPRMVRSGLFALVMATAAAGCHGTVTTLGGGGDDDAPVHTTDPAVGGKADAGTPAGDIDAAASHEIDASNVGGDVDAAPAELTWKQANLTNFTSYPEPGSDECQNYNGCLWEGMFAFVNGKQTEEWVMMHNIVAVHSKDADAYGLKKLRLRQGGNEIDVTVYDECSDNDCNGCCTQNSAETGFLIDIEKYTMERFGSGEGIVDFACLDCN
jgi:hypothetical protein